MLYRGPRLPVTFSAQGHATIRDFEVTFYDVGADVESVAPDGTVIASTNGVVPREFIGVLKFNPETGETILEPQHSLEGQAEELCKALSA